MEINNMKHLILILILIAPMVFASSYMSESDVVKCNNESPPYTTYFQLKSCQQKTGETCHKTDGKDCETHTPQNVEVDDFDKPILEVYNEQPCNDEAECLTLRQPQCDGGDPETCVSYCEDRGDSSPYPKDGFHGDRDGDSNMEAWCVRPTGNFEQKTVVQLVEDATLKAAKEQRQSDKAAEKSRRKTKRDEGDDCLKAITDPDALLPADVLPTLKCILKFLDRE